MRSIGRGGRRIALRLGLSSDGLNFDPRTDEDKSLRDIPYINIVPSDFALGDKDPAFDDGMAPLRLYPGHAARFIDALKKACEAAPDKKGADLTDLKCLAIELAIGREGNPLEDLRNGLQYKEECSFKSSQTPQPSGVGGQFADQRTGRRVEWYAPGRG